MATGTAVVDFGVFPGKSDASVAVTGQSGILSTSLVEAWLFGSTSDHSEDEHRVESLRCDAGSVVAGTGFTIYLSNTNQVTPRKGDPDEGKGTRIYGQWRVAWAWV